MNNNQANRVNRFDLKFFFVCKKWILAFDEHFDLIRCQYEDLEREKNNLVQQQTSQEQRFQSEMEKLTAEKE